MIKYMKRLENLIWTLYLGFGYEKLFFLNKGYCRIHFYKKKILQILNQHAKKRRI